MGRLVLVLIGLIATAWAFGAICYDGPFGSGNKTVAALLVVALLVLPWFVKPWLRKVAVFLVLLSVILIWWFSLSPTNKADWQADVTNVAWADVQGDEVMFHNVRNCDYRTESDYTAHWETRTAHLSKLTGVDLALTYWGSPYIAHPIVSFQFADALPLCFSIETRKKIRQSYSTIGGIYRQFTLIYIVADERDVLRLRSNYREGEDVYLYRTTLSPAQARGRFLEYIRSLNDLREKPRWYNALTTNCTTSIRTQHPPNERIPWDWRILLNGKGDELMYEHHVLATGGLSFPELKARSLINARARSANDSPDFSRVIRADLPRAGPDSIRRIAAKAVKPLRRAEERQFSQ